MAAQMGLLPDEWWAMTPREFKLHCEREQLAELAANIITHRPPARGEKNRKMITVDDLMGKKRPIITSKEEFKAQLQARYEQREQEMGW